MKNFLHEVVVLMNHVRTSREELLGPKKSILRILRNKNWFQRYMMSIKNISDGVVVPMNLVRTPREELLGRKI